MSDTNESVVAVEYVEKTIGADHKFFTPEWNSVDALVAAYGEGAVLDLVNSEVSGRIRTKVSNSIKDNSDKGTPIPSATVVFTADQASGWRPATQEATAGQLFKEANKAVKAGDFEAAKLLFAKMAARMNIPQS